MSAKHTMLLRHVSLDSRLIPVDHNFMPNRMAILSLFKTAGKKAIQPAIADVFLRQVIGQGSNSALTVDEVT